MGEVWIFVSVCALAIASLELFLLNRQRRLLLLDPRHRRFLRSYLRAAAHSLGQEEEAAGGVVAHERRHAPPVSEPPARADDGVSAAVDDRQPLAPRPPEIGLLYVDSEGRCAAANEVARRLLQGHEAEARLSDVLSGRGEDIGQLLDHVARKGVVQRYPALLGRPYAIPVKIDAIALRDRDSNFWGAALLVPMRDAPLSPGRSAAAPSPQ